jgi:hypothetical protein
MVSLQERTGWYAIDSMKPAHRDHAWTALKFPSVVQKRSAARRPRFISDPKKG